MLPLLVHFGLAIYPLQLEVCGIIIILVIFRVTRIDDEGFYEVGAEYTNGPVVKISVMDIIAYYLWIELV